LTLTVTWLIIHPLAILDTAFPGGFMVTAPFVVFVLSAVLIIGVFGVVAAGGGRHRTADYAATQRFRLLFFATLSVILLTFLAFTLGRLPYSTEASVPDLVVYAVGKQYEWSLTEKVGPSLETWTADFSPTVTIPVRTTVEFRVTTLDVNHGFSLYAPDGHLVTQTQAMPGYVNRLRLSFDQPGTYTVLCLEFCGLSHHRMRGVVEVR
jgi:cytochrome c oxidase subunit II